MKRVVFVLHAGQPLARLIVFILTSALWAHVSKTLAQQDERKSESKVPSILGNHGFGCGVILDRKQLDNNQGTLELTGTCIALIKSNSLRAHTVPSDPIQSGGVVDNTLTVITTKDLVLYDLPNLSLIGSIRIEDCPSVLRNVLKKPASDTGLSYSYTLWQKRKDGMYHASCCSDWVIYGWTLSRIAGTTALRVCDSFTIPLNDEHGKNANRWFSIRRAGRGDVLLVLTGTNDVSQSPPALIQISVDEGKLTDKYQPPQKGWPKWMNEIESAEQTDDGSTRIMLRCMTPTFGEFSAQGIWKSDGGKPIEWKVGLPVRTTAPPSAKPSIWAPESEPATYTRWISANTIRLVSTTNVLLDLLRLHASTPASRQTRALVLSLPDGVLGFQSVDFERNHACAYAKYALSPVPSGDIENTKRHLNDLVELPWFGATCIKSIIDPKEKDLYARFVRRIDLTKEQTLIKFIPDNWYPTTHGKIPTALWIECGLVLNDSELPIQRLRYVRPVVAETDSDLFYVIEEWYTGYWARELYVNGMPIFTMTGCKDYAKTSAALMQIFLSELKREFRVSPINALPSLGERKYQLVLTRTDENSLVLKKTEGPLTAIYEMSTYCATWYCKANDFNDSRYFSTLAEPHEKADEVPVMLNLEHVLLISADAVHYQEDTRDKARMKRYMREYRREVDRCVFKAIEATQKRVGSGAVIDQSTGGIKIIGDFK